MVTAGTPISSQVAAAMPGEIPLWVDLNGAIMPELQAKVAVCPDPNLFRLVSQLYIRLLCRGDHFSTVSETQRKMVIGELGMAARLNRQNFGHDLVSVIPNGIDPDQALPRTDPVIRGKVCGENDFVLLWSGGYNDWVDIPTLFSALEHAMEKEPGVHYVSTGGGIAGHYEEGYESFRKQVEGSPHRSRYHLLGWLPFDQVPETYFEADCGINVDLDIYESEFGARNRFLSWSQAALPFVTTVTTEISREYVDQNLAWGVPPGDAESLGAAILNAAHDREECKRRGTAGKEHVLSHYTFDRCAQPLLKWAEAPRRAPDRENPPPDLEPLEQCRWTLENNLASQGRGKHDPPGPSGRNWWRSLKSRLIGR
jgi:glycosyltransferase involved in cell wall biosynthesis